MGWEALIPYLMWCAPGLLAFILGCLFLGWTGYLGDHRWSVGRMSVATALWIFGGVISLVVILDFIVWRHRLRIKLRGQGFRC